MTLEPRDRLGLAVAAVAVVLLGAAAYLAVAPTDAGVADDPGDPGMAFVGTASPATTAEPGTPGMLVIDVEGGVRRPGIVTLSAGARVADAIRAAGGYAEDADLAAAAGSINLAAPLVDGAQVYVPILGAPSGQGGGGGATGGGEATGLVNLNTASAAALEGLPGIGPVTAAKIIAAREEAPFASLDELVDRKVMNRGQLEGIRELVTL